MPQSKSHSRINNLWYQSRWYHRLVSYLLWPCSLTYLLVVNLRRLLYKIKILPSKKFDVPIIIVGNLTVGGTGKTPFVIWLYQFLKNQGKQPGIIIRGYKGQKSKKPIIVTEKTTTQQVGDEAILIYEKTKAPMAVHKNRRRAAQSLLDHRSCDLIISDDGLQHYALKRDLEIAIIDGQRLLGNVFCLPAGPLRESKRRLKKVDIVLINGQTAALPSYFNKLNHHSIQIAPSKVYNLKNPEMTKQLVDFKKAKVHALAAIGNPERFFKMLESAGLDIESHPYPDHHQFHPQDFNYPETDVILITEKDAVKCQNFAQDNIWVVAIDLLVSGEATNQISNFLKTE